MFLFLKNICMYVFLMGLKSLLTYYTMISNFPCNRKGKDIAGTGKYDFVNIFFSSLNNLFNCPQNMQAVHSCVCVHISDGTGNLN